MIMMMMTMMLLRDMGHLLTKASLVTSSVRNISSERRLEYNEDDNDDDNEHKNDDDNKDENYDDNEDENYDDNHNDYEGTKNRQACGTSLVSGGWIVTYNEDKHDDDNEDKRYDDNEDNNDDDNEGENYDDIHNDHEEKHYHQACGTSLPSGGCWIMMTIW